MKEKINVIVIEDNEYYNNMLSNAVQQCVNSLLLKGKYQLILRSFTSANEFMSRIRSNELDCNNSIVFIDYYLGEGINASHVIRLIREHSCDTMVVLLSQSGNVREKADLPPYDYFVVKDDFASSFCSLCLRQFIENKFSVTLD